MVDDSKPAVNFRLIAFPNQWSRAAALSTDEVSPKHVAYQQFFQRLDELRDEHKFTNARAAQPRSWYAFSSGVRGLSWAVAFTRSNVRTELYINTGDAERNEQIFDELMNNRASIEKEFGETLEWERLDEKRACCVACYRAGAIEDPSDKLDEVRAWAIDAFYGARASSDHVCVTTSRRRGRAVARTGKSPSRALRLPTPSARIQSFEQAVVLRRQRKHLLKLKGAYDLRSKESA